MTYRAALLALVAAIASLASGRALAASPGQGAADRGAALYRSGDYRGARDAFGEAVRLDPGHVQAWESLGWAEHRLGHDDEALRIWKELLRLHPDRGSTVEAIASVEDRRRRAEARPAPARPAPRAAPARRAQRDPGREAERSGDVSSRADDDEAAENAYRDALRWRPDDPRLLTKLGATVEKAGRVSEAVEIWRKAAASPGAPPKVYGDLARAHVELGQLEEARSLFGRAEETTPRDDPGSLFQLAEVAFAIGDHAAAERSLSALLSLPGLKKGWGERSARLFVKHGLLDRAVAFFGGAGASPARSQALAWLATTRATAAFKARRFDEAARSFEQALQLDPDDRYAMRDLGLAYQEAGRAGDTERIWRKYAEAFPQLAEPHDLLALLYLGQRAFGRALEESKASLEIDPTQRGAKARYLRSLFGLSRMNEARQLAVELAQRYPKDVQVQRLLADALTASREFRSAARQWKLVMDLDPKLVVARQNWVRAMYEAGQVEAALREARRLARARDAPAPILELLAQDAGAREDLEGAATWYRELTRRFPGEFVYWHNLYNALGTLRHFDEQIAVAREAVRHVPDRVELQTDLATALANAGKYDEAIPRIRRVVQDYPDNRSAYEGLVAMLSATGDLKGALHELSRNTPSFYKDYEQKMIEASLRSRMNDFGAARRLLRAVAEPPPGQHYVPILLYHGVVEPSQNVQISGAAFEAQMAALASHGYHAITMTELAEMLDGHLPFPPKPILITFDDARADSFAFADPILEKLGLKATMFVPTGRIGADDAFHAGWATLTRYANTGRWDLQAHGHNAHDPVVMDAHGTRGVFLIDRAWLRAEHRTETYPEFLRRLETDYFQCKRMMQEHFPHRLVVGYAYPLNQVGEGLPGRDRAISHNETLARKYFRFGLLQDATGYNSFPPGAEPAFLLRRFEVPRQWSGEELIEHLARYEPSRAARVQLARLTLDEGRPEAARDMIEHILDEEPLVAAEGEETLAQVAWNEDRNREAAEHLAMVPQVPQGSGGGESSGDRLSVLSNQLAWRNDPRLGLQSSASGDSDGRSTLESGSTFRYPLPWPMDLELGAGLVRIGERGRNALTGPELSLGGSAGIGRRLDVAAWGRYRRMSSVPESINGGLRARLRLEQHAIGARWSYADVETIDAETKRIRTNVFSADYDYQSPRWRVQGDAARSYYDDGNVRTDVHATALRLFGSKARWGVGVSLGYEDSRFRPPDYYAPRDLAQAVARVTYRYTWNQASWISLDGGAGATRDLVNGLRPTALAGIALSRSWGSKLNFGTTLNVQGRAVPGGYSSVDATLLLETHF